MYSKITNKNFDNNCLLLNFLLILALFTSQFTKNEDDPGIADGSEDTGVKSGRACPSAEAEGSKSMAWQLSTLEEVTER
jgi:hypothetical protein